LLSLLIIYKQDSINQHWNGCF